MWATLGAAGGWLQEGTSLHPELQGAWIEVRALERGADVGQG